MQPAENKTDSVEVSTKNTYSQEDIKNLVLKGKDNLHDMNNVYYEVHQEIGITRCFYKDNRSRKDIYRLPSDALKDITTETKVSSTIIDLQKGKKYYTQYYKQYSQKITDINKTTLGYGFQETILSRITNPSDPYYWCEFSYIKDDTIEEKDCILIKENVYRQASNEIALVHLYWLEKSTGFNIAGHSVKRDYVITDGDMVPGWFVKNISFETVKDSDFIF